MAALPSCLQKYSKEGAKKVLLEMEDQKQSYEQKAKETLQKLLEEKTAAEQQLESTQVQGRAWLGGRMGREANILRCHPLHLCTPPEVPGHG